MKVSIAIPAYKYNEDCLLYLDELLDSIYKQDYINYEVVISDHTKDDSYCDIINKYSSLMSINYFKNENGLGNISLNTNNCINKCSGDIIKVMHQDDSFFTSTALSKIVYFLTENPEKNWGACGFIHNYMTDIIRGEVIPTIRREMIPSLETTIGNPSVSFFRRNLNNPDLYDENIYYYLDKVFHDDLAKKYGPPLIISDICILIRMHKDNSQFKLITEKNNDLIKIQNRKK